MVDNEFSAWFEKQYLEWQMKNGRASIRSFAAWLGINHALVIQWINGKANPGHKTILLLAAKLGPEVYTFFDNQFGIPGLDEIVRIYVLADPEKRGRILEKVRSE